LNAIPEGRLTELAVGPKIETRTTTGKAQGKPAAPSVIRYDDAWLAALPEPTGGAQWECLSKAIYFEARGETLRGQFAVAEVILNRVDSQDYPSTICGVVQQRGGGGCQFSYICDGRADRMRDPEAMWRAERIAAAMMNGAPRALTMGATHFHTRQVRPGWARRFPQTAAIGAHLFYKQP
jgi:spore germination cell wall hydrolase CwlJ-like protein